MSKAPRTSPTERIAGPDWEDGEYAVVRTYLSGIDRQRIRDASTRVDPATGTEHRDVAGGTLQMVRAGLVELHVTYDDGTLIPLSDEGIAALPSSYLAYILTTLTELWAAWERPAPEAKPGQTQEAAAKAATFPAPEADPAGAARPGTTRRSAG